VSLNAAAWIASIGLAVQLVASFQTGAVPLALGVVASGSALAYNLFLSRTPVSPLPYVVSFGLLPAWIAAGVGIPIERVLPAIPLVAPFAMAAHLANTLRDFEVDASGASRSLAQVIGRRNSRLLAAGLALAVGLGVRRRTGDRGSSVGGEHRARRHWPCRRRPGDPERTAPSGTGSWWPRCAGPRPGR